MKTYSLSRSISKNMCYKPRDFSAKMIPVNKPVSLTITSVAHLQNLPLPAIGNVLLSGVC